MPKKSPSMQQPALFDVQATHEQRAEKASRKVPLDRNLVVDALRDIYRLSSEPHIRQIAEDVLFAHRIPVRETL